MTIDVPVADDSQTEVPRGRVGRRGRSFDREQIAAVAVTLVALAPVIAVVAQRAGRVYLPTNDSAVIDLRVRDVLSFSRNTPLVGIYSHFGWSHPGPVMFYLVAPFAWLFGYAPWATLVGFTLLQGVAVVWTARLAWKTGGLRWTAVWMTIMAVTCAAMGPSALQVPWNPYVTVPFFVLFLLQCWAVARGEVRRLLGLAFVASFLVQTHVGYAVLVALPGAWAIGRMAAGLWREHRRPALSVFGWPLVVLVVMWFPVLVLDPLLDTPNNVHQLASFYTHHPADVHALGFSSGLGYLATEFRWLPPWLGGHEGADVSGLGALPSATGWLAVPVVLVALAWWSAARRKRRELSVLSELVAVVLVAGVVSLTLLLGRPVFYVLYWRTVAGVATVVLTGAVIVDSLVATRRRWVPEAGTALLAAAVAVASGVATESVVAHSGPVSATQPTAGTLLAQLDQEGLPSGRILLRPWGTTLGGVAAALVDGLSRQGVPVFVDRSLGFELGYGRTADDSDVRSVLFVSENSGLYSVGSQFPDARVLAVSHPLPPAEQARLVGLQRRVWAVLEAHGESQAIQELGSPMAALEFAHLPGLTGPELEDLVHLNEAVSAHGCLCSVIEFPAGKELSFQPAYMARAVLPPAGPATPGPAGPSGGAGAPGVAGAPAAPEDPGAGAPGPGSFVDYPPRSGPFVRV